MPLTTAADISVVLSGGATNINPNASLGGDPSSSPVVSGVLNNLFDDVSSGQSKAGLEDFRCVYLFNDGPSAIYNVSLWAVSAVGTSSSIRLGIEQRNETQRVTITGGPTGGSLSLSYRGHSFATAYSPNSAAWAANIQAGLLALTDGSALYFHDVTVTAQNAGAGSVIFDIAFAGLDGSRNLDQLVAGNQLLPSGPVSVSVTTPQLGAPVNTIAPEINLPTTPPGGVIFSDTSSADPLAVPYLSPNEGLPLWVQRTTPAGAQAAAADDFTLNFRADSLP